MSASRNYENRLRDSLLPNLILTFFNGGPKDGNQSDIRFTDEIGEVMFSGWTPRHHSYNRPKSSVSNKLYWSLVAQRTWETSVLARGISSIEGHPILFARRLSTTRWETFEVVTLKRGLGFTATPLRGYVFRLGEICHFHPDRKLGERRFKKAIRAQTLALLNAADHDECPW